MQQSRLDSAAVKTGLQLCLFDLDYTLLRLALDPLRVHLEVLAEYGVPVEPDRLRAAYRWSWDQYLRHGYRYPSPYEAYLQGAKDTLRKADVVDADGHMAEQIMARFEIPDSVRIYADAPQTLDFLRARGIRIGLATGRWHDPAEDLDRCGLARYIDVAFYSGDLGAQKDEAAYWEKLLDREGLAAQAVALVDDNAGAVAAARGVGLRAFSIQRADSPLQAAGAVDLTALEALPGILGLR